jgi:DegV family protein with EDD domain
VAQVKVVSDSACDLPREFVERYKIAVVPLTIRFGTEEFVDGQDLTPAEFWARCKASKVLPETAAPAPGAFQAAYEQARIDGYDGVIVISLSSALSATYQAAVLGAEGLADTFPIRIVDSKAVSMAQGLIALEVAEKAATGAGLDELVALAEATIPKVGIVGTLDTLEHLIKGGRVGGAKALLGSMLSIKPLLELKDGIVAEAGRQRTRSKALAALLSTVQAAAPLRQLALVHGAASDVAAVEAQMKNVACEQPLIVGEIGPVAGTHGGPGIVCACWIKT